MLANPLFIKKIFKGDHYLQIVKKRHKFSLNNFFYKRRPIVKARKSLVFACENSSHFNLLKIRRSVFTVCPDFSGFI